MRSYRLNRLFDGSSGRCLDVAVDHGFFGETAFLQGIEDMPAAIDTLVAAGPDALQLAPGQAALLQSRPGRGKPQLVLRTDVANVYGRDLPDELYSEAIRDAVGQAVRLDAVCVVVNLLDIPERPDVRRACVRNVMRIQADCATAGMPLMVEPLAFAPRAGGGGYDSVGDPERIVGLVRQAAELGADVIKADPTDDPGDYARVIRVAAPVPVLVRGGGRVSDEELLARTRAVLDQGASGIVYGRNIIQHISPAAITRALMAMLHSDLSAEQAQRQLAEEAGS
jgi:DhnA family fructose-bisphosphate aldolase class Ia